MTKGFLTHRGKNNIFIYYTSTLPILEITIQIIQMGVIKVVWDARQKETFLAERIYFFLAFLPFSFYYFV